jgi:hypothetical protein
LKRANKMSTARLQCHHLSFSSCRTNVIIEERNRDSHVCILSCWNKFFLYWWSWCFIISMGANVASISQGRSSFNFGKRKKAARGRWINSFCFLEYLPVHYIEYIRFRCTIGFVAFKKTSASPFNRRYNEMYQIF